MGGASKCRHLACGAVVPGYGAVGSGGTGRRSHYADDGAGVLAVALESHADAGADENGGQGRAVEHGGAGGGRAGGGRRDGGGAGGGTSGGGTETEHVVRSALERTVSRGKC